VGLVQEGQNCVMGIMVADHLIEDFDVVQCLNYVGVGPKCSICHTTLV